MKMRSLIVCLLTVVFMSTALSNAQVPYGTNGFTPGGISSPSTVASGYSAIPIPTQFVGLTNLTAVAATTTVSGMSFPIVPVNGRNMGFLISYKIVPCGASNVGPNEILGFDLVSKSGALISTTDPLTVTNLTASGTNTVINEWVEFPNTSFAGASAAVLDQLIAPTNTASTVYSGEADWNP